MSAVVTVAVFALRGEDDAAAAATVRAVVDRWGGRLVDARGGRVRATFDAPSDALAAATAAQQALHDARRPPRLGVGIHVGEGSARAPGDGPAVRAEQLADRASGGQVLTTPVVRGLLPEGNDLALEECAGAGDDAGTVLEVRWEPVGEPAAVRVVVADDAVLIRSGLVELLTAAGLSVVAQAGDADELLEAVAAESPDLVVTDIRMPPTNTDEGLRAAGRIREEHPGVAVLVLSQHVEARAAASLLDGRPAGIGYLLKERVGDLAEFVDACRTVAGGGSVVDPIVAERSMRRRQDDERLRRLSDREREVLELMAQGRSNAAIADALVVGSKTVETHVRSIFQKLDLVETPEGNRRVAAVLHWLQARDG